MLEVSEGRLLLQTIRGHDQFNTTIYGHADRYRGISGHRHPLRPLRDARTPSLG